MEWLILFFIVTLVGVAGVVVNINQVRFSRALNAEIDALRSVPGAEPTDAPAMPLPPPVRRYYELAVAGRPAVRTLTMRHGGTFRTSPTTKPLPIAGEQFFTSDPPGFVWTGRIRMAPCVWIDARDMLKDGQGNMRVLLDDTIRVADVKGPAIDRGAALRVLAEMPWFPTAMFDPRFVRWSPIDATNARATLVLGDMDVSCVFTFGPDGLPSRSSAERPTESGEVRPWGGTYADYRRIDGLLVPFEAKVTWELESGPFEYAHWRVESFEFDASVGTVSSRGARR